MPEKTLAAYLQKSLTISELNLWVLDLPQKEAFLSAIGQRKSRKTIIVEWVDEQGVKGYGECSCRPDPYYSAEFMDAAVLLIETFIAPHLKSAKTYADLLGILSRIRGWEFTRAAVEAAAHDMINNRDGEQIMDYFPLPRIDQIPVGISIGLQANAEALAQVVTGAKADGYRRLKFKISPKSDIAAFESVKPLLQDVEISFDANGTFDQQAMSTLGYFVDLGGMIEQPFPVDRIDCYRDARRAFPDMYVCLDEEVKSLGGLQKCCELGLLNELNLKVGRVGGLYQSLKIIEFCHQQKLPCWIGGMFETGIGRSLNLQFAAFLPKATAHDLSPSSRYFVEDIITPPVTMSTKGLIDRSPNHRVEVEEKLLKKYTIRRIPLTF